MQRNVMAGGLVIACIGQPASAAPEAQPTRTVRASAADLLHLVEQLTIRGDRYQASRILDLLARDPNIEVRSEARYRLALLLKNEGRSTEAAVLLRRILDEKPEASAVRLELARLLHALGDSDAALRELRAAQASGLPPAVARMVDRYSEALRAERPIGASLEVAIAPDSNINHATRSDTLGTVLGDFEIDEDSKARSGTGLSIRGHAYRRFPLGGDHQLLVRMSGNGDLYAKSRFNNIAADLAGGPELQLGRNRVNLELGATQHWFGQKPFLRSARIAATFVRPLGIRTQIRVNGSASIVNNQLNDLQDGMVYSGRVGAEHAVTPTTGLAFTVGGDRQGFKDAGYATTGWRSGLVGWKSVGRMTLIAGVDFGRLKADERLALLSERRSDRYSQFTLGATLRPLTFHGFAPVVRLRIERNRSTIAVYDYERRRSEFAIVRAF